MFSMARPPAGRAGIHIWLPLFAAIALLAVLGHFMADAANLWPSAAPTVVSISGPHQAGGARQDADSTLHTGFAIAFPLTFAIPLVLSILLLAGFPRLFLRPFSPLLLPPKTL